MDFRFSGKSVVITGAAGGIGSRAAALFAQEGAKLALADLELEKLRKVRQTYGLPEEQCMLFPLDISDETAVQAMVRQVAERCGTIDVMFNNAGMIGASAKFEDFPTESMRQVLRVNVMGTFFGMKYVLPWMKKAGSGVIINTSSISGCRGMPDTAAYVASKHAVMGMTKSAAVEYAPFGVRVCAVCPSPVSTPMMQEVEDGMVSMGLESRQAIRSKLLAPIPMGRYASADEVAKTVLFLASDDASFISGSAIMVDGCFTA